VSLEELFAGKSEVGDRTSEVGKTANSTDLRPPTSDLRSPSCDGAFPLFLALDCLHDPHNVGAIFRTAAFFGVAGIVVTRDRSAPLNATVYDVASGGLEFVPFSVQTNLRRALDAAKEHGVWVLGTSERAETDYTAVPLDRAWLLVVGNEESGMRRLTAEHCDMACRIPPQSTVTSLNVSVAAGILIARFAGGL
jgi:23S rRNA (guanosine2251-2'-O)-methyltransferase